MEFQMARAIMLAENLHAFLKLVAKKQQELASIFDKEKFHQLKLLAAEYKLKMIADELLRINQFSWDGSYTLYLTEMLEEGVKVIEEYIKRNEKDLYIFSGRIHLIKSLANELLNK